MFLQGTVAAADCFLEVVLLTDETHVIINDSMMSFIIFKKNITINII